MIVVVEGPSAAGKTTWSQQHGALVVGEDRLLAPADAIPEESTRFWLEANCSRWAVALETEAHFGDAVCDTDPLKLNYQYCLARIGALPWRVVHDAVGSYRDAIVEKSLGIADVIVCSFPAVEVLEQRKLTDESRRRRNFELHRQMSEPLHDWYGALDSAEPGRVVWHLPDDLPASVVRDRFDITLFDRWMAALELPG